MRLDKDHGSFDCIHERWQAGMASIIQRQHSHSSESRSRGWDSLLARAALAGTHTKWGSLPFCAGAAVI